MVSLGINAHLLSGQEGYRRAGIHHYITNVLAHLPHDSQLCYTVFTRHAPAWKRPDFQIVRTVWPTERRWMRILWEQLAWPVLAVRRQLDLLHSMAFVTPIWSPAPTVVTVYDLSFLHFPEQFPALQRLYLTTQTRRSCRRARRVVTISESSREDVRRFFGVPSERIDVVPPGVDPAFRLYEEDEVTAFRQQHGLPERFVLHVGTLQPRKNIPVLLEAMAQLNRPHIPLYLVGGKGWLYDDIFTRVEALGLQKRVHFAGYVPDEHLPLWYAAATVFVFPSIYEGFGMPVVQALASGTPVVAADTSAIPEAGGKAILRFPPADVGTLVNQMLAVLDNGEQATTMRRVGLDHVRQFSWEKAGQKMATVYRRALAAV